MSTMLIANNCTRENGSFLGDQLCYLKTAYLMVQNQPGIDKVIMSLSPNNEMDFVWTKFIQTFDVEVIYDNLDPGNWPDRWGLWNRWRSERQINGIPFDHYRELYLRIHGLMRQNVLCGYERGAGRKNIYEYVYYGQEHLPDKCVGADWFDETLMYHPSLTRERDVYISPHCKTQGNATFTFEYWHNVVHRLIDAGISVTVGYDGQFCEDLVRSPLFRKHWGDHKQWMEQVCTHKLVACGNTGTGWLAAACGVPLITMEPHNSCMADHRYRECGLKNIVEVVDGYTLDEFDNDMDQVAEYCAKRIVETVRGETPHKRISRVREVAEACHVGAQYSVNPYEKLKLMADEFLKVAHLDGDVADLGSYRGGSALVLRKLCNKHLHLFDTWEGNPYDDPLCHHKRGEWKASLEECRKVVGWDDETYCWKGVFSRAQLDWEGEFGVYEGDAAIKHYKFCFVYVDMDTYQATKDAIEFFWPRLVKGGVMFFDDYGWEPCAGVKKAVDEVFHGFSGKTVWAGQYSCIVKRGVE